MIKERYDFFQNAKFFPFLNIYNSPDDLCVQICMKSKFDAILQPVINPTKTREPTRKKKKNGRQCVGPFYFS